MPTKIYTPQELAARKYPLKVQNVVCNFSVDFPVHIELLADLLSGRYDPEVFPAMVSCCKNSGTKNSFFESGQIIIAGAKSFWDAVLAGQMCVQKLRVDFGIPFKMWDFAVKNIVCSAMLGYAVDLDLMHQVKKAETSFDAEDFPGLNYVMHSKEQFGVEDGALGIHYRMRIKEWSVTITVFAMGGIVVTGIRDPGQIPLIAEHMKLFKAFKQKKDFRRVPEHLRDSYYETKEWRSWGLLEQVELVTKSEKKKRKRELKKQDQRLLQQSERKRQKMAEKAFLAELKERQRQFVEMRVA